MMLTKGGRKYLPEAHLGMDDGLRAAKARKGTQKVILIFMDYGT